MREGGAGGDMAYSGDGVDIGKLVRLGYERVRRGRNVGAFILDVADLLVSA